MVQEIAWKQHLRYRDVVSKNELLKDIKTNLISLLNDYKGRGIENEDFYISEVKKMFTGGIVPSKIDWKIMISVLRELSEVKEQGVMYEHFIRDVSDTLGVSDLEKIRSFIEYITTLGPEAPTVSMVVDEFPEYRIGNLWATFENDITKVQKSNRGTAHWTVIEPTAIPYAKVNLYDARHEDIKEYTLTFKAGKFSKSYTFDAKQLGVSGRVQVNIPINWTEYFDSDPKKVKFTLDVASIDKRGNKGTSTIQEVLPQTKKLPIGFSTFELQYQPGYSQEWQYPYGYTRSGYITGDERSFGTFAITDLDGWHRFSIRGYDPGAGWSPWVNSPDYKMIFRGDPPSKPEPVVSKRELNAITITWPATTNTDYYNAYIWWKERDQEIKVQATSTRSVRFTGLSQNTSYNFYVEAVNEWDTSVGHVTGVTRKKVTNSSTWKWLEHKRWNGQSFWWGTYGYRLSDKSIRNAPGREKPHWKDTLSMWSGSLYQGHWKETSWGKGFATRGGGYRAWDGQSHGNNATYITMDYDWMRSYYKNKHITSVEISLTREGSPHGWPDEGTPLYLYNHNNANFSNTGSFLIYDWDGWPIDGNWNPVTANVNFKRNQTQVINNHKTKKMLQNIVDGKMRGFAFIKYYGSGFNEIVHQGAKDYMRFVPSSFQVTAHYYTIE